MDARYCHACGTAWESMARMPGRTETCVQCGADLHCCLNCRFYDHAAPSECREPNVERVLDKAKANFCDYFQFASREGHGQTSSNADDARRKFDDLFK